MSRIESEEFTLKDGKKVLIRKARISDATNMLEIFYNVIDNDEYNLTMPSDVKKLKMTVKKERDYIKAQNKDGNILLVAEINNRVAGLVNLSKGARERISHIASFHLSVHKRYRRNGVASALIKAAIKQAEKDPLIEKIELNVFANHTAAIRLYKKFGFVKEGRRKKEFKIAPGKYVDDILMYKFVK